MPEENRYLIAIGSPESPGMGLSALPRVAADVERICAFFTTDAQGYRRVLAEEIPLGASAPTIRTRLGDWFAAPEREDADCVVVYFAGHGDEAGRFKGHYLFTQDSTPHNLANTAIETAALPKLFFEGEGPRPQSVLVILDTCYSGKGSGQAAAMLAAAKEGLYGPGAGCWFLAAAGPADAAGDGPFVTALLAATIDRHYFGSGGAEFLNPVDVATSINEYFEEKGEEQRAEVDLVGGGKRRHRFIRNSRYSPRLPGAVLEDLQHWDSKARGVDDPAMPGDYFVGRQAALQVLTDWLQAKGGDRRARVVTGKPGSGKSAILGRLVTGLNGAARLPNTLASIHAHGLGVAGVVASLAAQLGFEESSPERLLPHLDKAGPTIRIIVDALDEASEPRKIEDQLLIPLGRIERVRLLVGTRKDGGRTPLGDTAIEIDLDSPEYFRQQDLRDYVLRRIAAPEFGSVFSQREAHEKVAELAAEVARRSNQSYLYARFVSRWLASTGASVDTGPSDWIERIKIPHAVVDAFGRDLERFEPATRRRLIDLLVPLAYAQGKGLPQTQLWCQLATAIAGRPYSNADIRELKEKVSYYLIRDVEDEETVYRLFHETFAQYFRDLTADEAVHRAIYKCLTQVASGGKGGRPDWAQVHEPYIMSYLGVHAQRAGTLEQLVRDTEFLVHTNPRTFVVPLHSAALGRRSPEIDSYLSAYAKLLTDDVPVRIQYLALAAAQHCAHTLLSDLQKARSRCSWFPVKAWHEAAASHVIASAPELKCACLLPASCGPHRMVAVSETSIEALDLATGERAAFFSWPGANVTAVAGIGHREDVMVVTVEKSGMVRVIDVTRNREVASHPIPGGDPFCLCVFDQRPPCFLVVGAGNGELRSFSLPDLVPLEVRQGHKTYIQFLTKVESEAGDKFISGSGSYDKGRIVERRQVKLWDARTVQPLVEMKGPEGGDANWGSPVEVGGKTYLPVYFSPFGALWLYDLETAKPATTLGGLPALRLFGCFTDPEGEATLLSGFSDEFKSIHLAVDTEDRSAVVIHADSTVPADGGAWFGPVEISGSRAVVTASRQNGIRAWNLGRLLAAGVDRRGDARVGLVVETGEPLFCVAATPSGRHFCALSRYGNLRVWSHDGGRVGFKQLITSLQDERINDFEWLRMVEIGQKPVYVTAGKNGVLQAWELNGEPALPPLKINQPITCASAHVSNGRLIAFVALNESEGEEPSYKIKAWDLHTGKQFTAAPRQEMRFDHHYDHVIEHLAVADKGNLEILAAACRKSHRLGVWNIRAGKLWSSTRYDVSALAILTINHTEVVAVGDRDGAIWLGRADNGNEIASCTAHDGPVVRLCALATPVGDLLISAGIDGRIVAWNGDLKGLVEIQIGSRVTDAASLADQRVVATTERGFIIFQLA